RATRRDSPAHVPIRRRCAGRRGVARCFRDPRAGGSRVTPPQHRTRLHHRGNRRDYRYLDGGGEETSHSCEAAVARRLPRTESTVAGDSRMMNTQPELPKPPCPADATLYRSLAPRPRDGTLSPDEQKALRTHLRFCPSCREEAMAASDQVIEEGVRRHYGIPANVPPFLMLDDIQRRVSLAPAPDTLHASATPNTDEIVGIDSR